MGQLRYFNFRLNRRSKLRFYIKNEEPDTGFDVLFGIWLQQLFYMKEFDRSRMEIMYEFSQSAILYYSEVNYYREDIELQPIIDVNKIDTESDEVLFDENKIKTAIYFLDEVIKKLENEKEEVIEQYGGEKNFFKVLYDALPNYNLIEGIDSFSLNKNSIYYLKDFKQLLLLSLTEGLAHRAFII